MAISKRPLVLVVDDNAEARHIFCRYLSLMDCETMAVSGGWAAVDAIAGGRQISAVLLDIQMPDIDGFQTLQELRVRGFSGPIIAVTAYSLDSDRSQCEKAGFDAYIAKPVSLTELRMQLTCFLAKLRREALHPDADLVGHLPRI